MFYSFFFFYNLKEISSNLPNEIKKRFSFLVHKTSAFADNNQNNCIKPASSAENKTRQELKNNVQHFHPHVVISQFTKQKEKMHLRGIRGEGSAFVAHTVECHSVKQRMVYHSHNFI